MCLFCDQFRTLIIENKCRLAAFSSVHVQSSYQSLRLLLITYPWALNTHTTNTLLFFFSSLLLLPCQCHLSQHAGRKYSFISALSHKETIGCYTTTQQSLLCLVVDLSLGRAHTYMLSNTHTLTQTQPLSPIAHTGQSRERSLFLAHVNVSNQSGQGAL